MSSSAEKPVAGEHERFLALLKAQHEFPGEYHLSVITLNDGESLERVRRAVEAGLQAPLADNAITSRPSGAGKYSSHRFRVPCQTAEDVLAVYTRLHGVEGVIAVL